MKQPGHQQLRFEHRCSGRCTTFWSTYSMWPSSRCQSLLSGWIHVFNLLKWSTKASLASQLRSLHHYFNNYERFDPLAKEFACWPLLRLSFEPNTFVYLKGCPIGWYVVVRVLMPSGGFGMYGRMILCFVNCLTDCNSKIADNNSTLPSKAQINEQSKFAPKSQKERSLRSGGVPRHASK